MVTDEPRGMWPAALPWNTTRTMADVWAHDPKLDGRKPSPVRTTPESKELPPAKMGRPSSQNFRLQDWQGSFLHESCAGMTRDERLAWKGNAKQLAAVRQRYPNTSNLIASEVA